MCGGQAHYNTFDTHYYAEFPVPKLPTEVSEAITFYIYFNIFFNWPYPSLMNQFVPQLMLGNPLCNSSGPPSYHPKWQPHKTWVFGSQYFFEIHNLTTNKTDAHAVTGEIFNTTAGEVLWTKFSLDQETSAWSLGMGVKGDPTRTSTVVAHKPFMGLISDVTSSWAEDLYNQTWANSCWELYGAKDRAHYPGSGHTIEMDFTMETPNQFKWYTSWNTRGGATCPGSPNSTFAEKHNDTSQSVKWEVDWATFWG
jgi:hypothetical protein